MSNIFYADRTEWLCVVISSCVFFKVPGLLDLWCRYFRRGRYPNRYCIHFLCIYMLQYFSFSCIYFIICKLWVHLRDTNQVFCFCNYINKLVFFSSCFLTQKGGGSATLTHGHLGLVRVVFICVSNVSSTTLHVVFDFLINSN